MPNRMLRATICTSDNLDMLAAEEERFFYRLIVQADDYGRFDARPKILLSACFPLKREITEDDIVTWLGELMRSKLIVLYEARGRPHLQFTTWTKHQRLRAKDSKFPGPEDSGSRTLSLADMRGHLLAGDGK